MRIVPHKRPATGRAMVVTHHHAASAAVTGLPALSVREPMMAGLFGGGTLLLRGGAGAHIIPDGPSCAPRAASATIDTPAAPDDPLNIEAGVRFNPEARS